MLGEVLPMSDLSEQVVSQEREGPRPKVRNLDHVGQDEVTVQLEQRDQVHEDQVVVQGRGGEQRAGQEPLREPPDDQGRRGGEDHLRERAGERREDLLAPVHHETVGTVHEERGGAEIDHEAGALDPSSIANDDERVPELVDEDREVVEHPQHDEARRERCTADREVAGRDKPGEHDHAGDRDERLQGDDRLAEREAEAVVVEPLHDPVGIGPLDREGLRERSRPASALGHRVHRSRHELVDVPVPLLEEVPLVQGAHQVGDRVRIEVAGVVELLEHELLDRPRAVHLA